MQLRPSGCGGTRQTIWLENLNRDWMVLHAGFARTIYAARQYVSHGHILVNGKKVSIPSYRVKIEDVVSVKEESRNLAVFDEAREEMVGPAPVYLSRSKENMTAQLMYLPKRDEVSIPVEMSLAIEHYSR